jgi:putative transcriptional regulator
MAVAAYLAWLLYLTAAQAASVPHTNIPVPLVGGPELTATAVRKQPARGMFLIASPGMNDPNFSRTVVLLTRHDDTGTLGLIINRPLGVRAADALPPLEATGHDAGWLHLGGPVAVNSLKVLIRAPAETPAAERVFDDVHVLGDAGSVEDLLAGRLRVGELRLYAGHAGWAPGQLENELLRGDWLLWPADPETLFVRDPQTIWSRLVELASARWVRSTPDPTGRYVQSRYNRRSFKLSGTRASRDSTAGVN